MTTPQKNLAFIGGGSMGPIQIIYIAQQAAASQTRLDGITFHCIDPNGFANGGIAYGQARSTDFLNSVRSEMSPWDPEAFHAYCDQEGKNPEKLNTEFNYRAEYRDFLKEEFAKAKQIITALGGTIIEHKATATINRLDNGKIAIRTNQTDKNLITVSPEELTLTTGYGPNIKFEELKSFGPNAYTHNIYLDDPQHIPVNTGSAIVFIGSGPALFDFTNSIQSDPKDITLFVISTTGQTIEARNPANEINEPNFIPDNILSSPTQTTADDLIRRIKNDFTTASLRTDISNRRAALDINKTLKTVLNTMDASEIKKLIESNIFKKITHLATPAPQNSHDHLNKFNVQWIEGRLETESVSRSANGKPLTITIENRKSAANTKISKIILQVDHIINGTGHGRTNAPIIQSLIDQKLATKNPALDCLEVDDTGYKLKGSGIACIGPATHFGTDGIESFSHNAEARAKELIDQIKNLQKNTRSPAKECLIM